MSLDEQQEADLEFELWLQPQSQLARFRPYPPELYAQAYAYYPYPTYSTAPYGYPTGAASHRAGIIHQGMSMVPADVFRPPYLQPDAYSAVMGQQHGYPSAKGKRRASDDGSTGSTKKQKHPRIRPDVDPNFKFIGEINGQRMY
ncbi:hypothetical protein M405DRAFT_864088 [Rhizopogon salebrosus TDB-379]|nr:hypothetical protein M405DRAFT_864088 [Rhizopogon salebrosus TDB-379]